MSWLSIKKQLASPKISWQLCLLCSLGGLVAASVIISFLSIIDIIQVWLDVAHDNYTSLDRVSRFDLPVFGSLIILIISWFTGYKYLRTGIPFVLHRLKAAYGVIPFRNTLNQYLGGIISLSAGFSVGREGPIVHLGAAASSAIGRVLNLPLNSIRTLCAAGVAAGIAATFNTPIAAVIFVMEVILREYNVATFIPIMLSAIIGSILTQFVLGGHHDYAFVHQFSLTLYDYPAVIACAIFIGCLATLFNRYMVLMIKSFAHWHIVTRFMLAAFITSILGYFVPYAMGTGASAVEFLQQQPPHFWLLFGLLIAKLIMTIAAIGLGLPGGIIGPIIAIGAIAGAAAAASLQWVLGIELSHTDFILLGMAAFMAATLNAPLAALLAVVELSAQLPIMLPAMLSITIACLVSGQLFKNKSIFILQLDLQQLSYQRPPIEASLQNIGVMAKMQEHFTIEQVDDKPHYVPELSNFDAVIEQHNTEKFDKKFTLIEAKSPGIELPMLPIPANATLAEAYALMHKIRKVAVYVYDQDINQPIGYLTFSQLRQYLLKG